MVLIKVYGLCDVSSQAVINNRAPTRTHALTQIYRTCRGEGCHLFSYSCFRLGQLNTRQLAAHRNWLLNSRRAPWRGGIRDMIMKSSSAVKQIRARGEYSGVGRGSVQTLCTKRPRGARLRKGCCLVCKGLTHVGLADSLRVTHCLEEGKSNRKGSLKKVPVQ